MTTPFGSTRRIEELERRATAADKILASLGREPISPQRRWVYLAKTARESVYYPDGDANTYPIIFLNRESTDAEGDRAADDIELSVDPRTYGRTVNGQPLLEDEVCYAFPMPKPVTDDKCRWILEPLTKIYWGNLNEELTPGGSAEVSVYTPAGTTPDDWEDSGEDRTVYEVLLQPGDAPIAEGTKIAFVWYFDRFVMIGIGGGDTLDIVRVYHSGSAVGADVAANAGGVHPGQVKRIIAGVMTEIEDCWIAFVDDYDTETGTIKAVNGDYYGPARLSGTYTHAGTTLPLYVLRRNFERIVHFELTSTLALSGNAEAIILSDDDADWADTALQIQVYDWFAPEGMWAGIAGYRGYAIRREGVHASGRQKYDILWMEQIAQTIQFTSTEYMGATTANRMAVTVNWYDHQGKQPVGSVIVRDPQGQFPDVHSGAKGTAVYDYQNGYYRVVSCQRIALFASALLTADSCGSSMSIDTFAVKPTGDYVGAPPTTPTAPANPCGHAGVDNDVVLLRRTSNAMPSPSWEVVDVSKHSTTIMTDVQVSGLTLQKKTRTVYVELCDGTAPSWATWHTGGECP